MSAFPSELNFHLPDRMAPSRKFELRTKADRSSYSAAGSDARITLPQMQRTFYNLQTGYLSGTVTFTDSTAVATSSAAVNKFSTVLGSWYSLFSRQVVSCGPYQLETIDRLGELTNMIFNMTLNPTSRSGLSNSMGFDGTANNLGVVMGASGDDIMLGSERPGPLDSVGKNTVTYSFTLPLIGILNQTKLWPAWVGELTIAMTLNSLNNFLVNLGNGGAAGEGSKIDGFSINELEYVVECLELTPESYQIVMAQNPDVITLKSSSYLFGSTSLPASQGAGAVDIPVQFKVGSLKEVLFACAPANAAEKTFAGINPNLNNFQFICNGVTYPQQPINVRRPAEAYMQIQKAWGSVYSSDMCGCAFASDFARASTASAPGGLYQGYNDDGTLMRIFPNKFYIAVDLEILNNNKETIYSGINTSGTSSTIRLDIGAPLANSVHNCLYWGSYDVLIKFDMTTGVVQAIV